MQDNSYKKLAGVLDTLPNGFPSTETGVELKLLQKIFTPEQAEIFCDLRLTFETAEQIATRSGRLLKGLQHALLGMAKKGQIWAFPIGGVWYFRMLPWIFGIYEFQLNHMDREFVELNEEYSQVYAGHFFAENPPLMQTLPVEEYIPAGQEAMPYEKVSTIIENGRSFLINECVCKKEQGLLDNPCERPLHVCLAIAPVPGVFERSSTGTCISKAEAFELIKTAEENALVHLTMNVQHGHVYICNCCSCCCGVLRTINLGIIPAWQVVNSHHYATIDAGLCTGCGICADKCCQVRAIEQQNDVYQVIPEKCIGCGLCLSTCPAEAIQLVRKTPDKIMPTPLTETDWFAERAALRGVDYSRYK